jgi:hypothetical protein
MIRPLRGERKPGAFDRARLVVPMRTLLAIAAVGAALLAATASAGREAAGATQVVDRTVLCTLAPSYLARGEKEFDFDAGPREDWPATATTPARSYPAFARVDTGIDGPASVLVAAIAFRHPEWGAGRGPAGPGVYLQSTRCRASAKRVPLTSGPLPGPPTIGNRKYECRLRGAIVVRVHAELRGTGTFRRVAKTYTAVLRDVERATVAVKSARTGKLVAVAKLDGGSSRVWTAAACT